MTSSITRAIKTLALAKKLVIEMDFETRMWVKKFIRSRPDLNTHDLECLIKQLDLNMPIIQATLNGTESLLKQELGIKDYHHD